MKETNPYQLLSPLELQRSLKHLFECFPEYDDPISTTVEINEDVLDRVAAIEQGIEVVYQDSQVDPGLLEDIKKEAAWRYYLTDLQQTRRRNSEVRVTVSDQLELLLPETKITPIAKAVAFEDLLYDFDKGVDRNNLKSTHSAWMFDWLNKDSEGLFGLVSAAKQETIRGCIYVGQIIKEAARRPGKFDQLIDQNKRLYKSTQALQIWRAVFKEHYGTPMPLVSRILYEGRRYTGV